MKTQRFRIAFALASSAFAQESKGANFDLRTFGGQPLTIQELVTALGFWAVVVGAGVLLFRGLSRESGNPDQS